jgi:hypothetical protein
MGVLMYTFIRVIGEMIMPAAMHLNGERVAAAVLAASFAFLLYDAARRYVFRPSHSVRHLYGSFVFAIGAGVLTWWFYRG